MNDWLFMGGLHSPSPLSLHATTAPAHYLRLTVAVIASSVLANWCVCRWHFTKIFLLRHTSSTSSTVVILETTLDSSVWVYLGMYQPLSPSLFMVHVNISFVVGKQIFHERNCIFIISRKTRKIASPNLRKNLTWYQSLREFLLKKDAPLLRKRCWRTDYLFLKHVTTRKSRRVSN